MVKLCVVGCGMVRLGFHGVVMSGEVRLGTVGSGKVRNLRLKKKNRRESLFFIPTVKLIKFSD